MIPDEAVVLRRTDACTCDYTTVTDFERRDGGFVPNRYEAVTRQSSDCPEHMPGATIVEFLEERIASEESDAMTAAAEFAHGGYGCFGPARVLAECAAKLAILSEHQLDLDMSQPYCDTCAEWWKSELGEGPPPVQYPCPTVRAVAAVYAGHPDYRQEWAS